MTARTQNAGLARLTATLAALGWWAQWGSGSGAAATANAVTTAGTAEARTACTAAQGTTNVANDTLVLTALITATAARTITEVGVFDAAGSGSPPAGGAMDYYWDHSSDGLGVGDSLTYTMKITYS